jgi:hypothetical protein
MDGSGASVGAPVAAGGVFFIRNIAGETEPPALMPPQPPVHNATVISIASRKKFQSNLTCPV